VNRPGQSGEPGQAPLDAEALWRLCTRLIEPDEARRHVTVVGDQALADPALRVVALIR
jgi:hypothetical protein